MTIFRETVGVGGAAGVFGGAFAGWGVGVGGRRWRCRGGIVESNGGGFGRDVAAGGLQPAGGHPCRAGLEGGAVTWTRLDRSRPFLCRALMILRKGRGIAGLGSSAGLFSGPKGEGGV